MSQQNGRLSTQVDEVRATLQERADTIMRAAAGHISGDKLFEMAARSCIANPKLLTCNRGSLVAAVAEAANLGLELGGVLGQAHLVPYGERAQLLVGYLGYKELAYRSGMVDVLDAEVVRPGDDFDYQLGTDCFLNHRPTPDATDQWQAVYAIARTSKGGWVVRVMSREQVERHRDKFAQGHRRGDSPWRTNLEAMAKKTVLRQLYKLLPLSSEVQTVVNREEYIEHGVPAGKIVSGDTVPTDDLDRMATDETQQTDPQDAAEAEDVDTASEPATTIPDDELPF